MKSEEIKFSFDIEFMEEYEVEDIFKKIEMINIRFDENLKPYTCNDEATYDILDVSNLNQTDVQKEIDSFFEFAFREITDKPLYRFTVLKDNDKLTILANISSLIFDYGSINDIYSLFNNEIPPEKDILNRYADHDAYLSSSDFEDDTLYWKNHLLDIGKHVKFHNINSSNYESIKIPLNNELGANLEKNNISKFNFFTGIFSLYLSRIDRTHGTLLKTNIPSNNCNTLLKIDFIKDYSFADYLDEIENIYINAVNHTRIDVENYLDENLSYYAIFDFSNLDKNITIKNGKGSALTLNIHDENLELLYNSDLFPLRYIENMAANIESLISNAIHSPDVHIGKINILSADEQNLLNQFCKGERIELDKEKTLAHAVRENATNTPDSLAVDDGVNNITYGDLERLSNSIAFDLSENYGICRGDHVALMMPRTYHFILLVLALNKIGAAFVPVDPLYPSNRIEHMIKISEATHIISTKELGNIHDFGINLILMEELDVSKDVEVDILARADDLFAILFTSGTSGLPKGAMIKNIHAPQYELFIRIFHWNEGETVGSFLSFSFIASFVIYGVLYVGAPARIFNEREQKDSLLLLKALKEEPMSSIILPPTLGIPIFEKEDLKLNYLITAGAKLNRLSKKERHTQIINYYGTTEIVYGIPKLFDLKNDERVTVGSPIPNQDVYILDENLNQMPIGVPGEICVSAFFISEGYINNPELTKKVYVDNPFYDGEGNEKMYRTGDIGFYNFDGEIEIVGREDDQLSVRGFRIESMEILKVMKSFKEISEVVLDVDYDNLIAYYTRNEDIEVEVIKDALKRELPYYMIPSIFIELKNIPLTSNGKIDKSALKKIFKENEDIDIDDKVLNTVLEMFKKVLLTEHVFIDEDFVSLGGNSLSAMKLQLLLEDEFGVTIFAHEIIKLSTPLNIANEIKFNLNSHYSDDVNDDISNSCTPPAIEDTIDNIPLDLDIYTVDTGCPLNESQINLYLDVLMNNTEFYHVATYMHIPKKYDLEKILDTLDEILEVHPIIGMHISNYYGPSEKKSLYSKIHDSKELLNELKELGDSFDDKSLMELLRENGWNIKKLYDKIRIVLKAFNGEYPYLIKGSKPPIVVESEFNDNSIRDFLAEKIDVYNYLSRFKIFELKDSYMLLAKFHHIIFDGMSANIFKQDFQTLLDGGTVDIDDGFLRMSAFHRQIKNTDKFIEAGNFFESMYSDINEVNSLVANKQSKGYSIKKCDLEFDYNTLESFLDNSEYNENLLFTSVFAYTLSKFANSEKVLFSMIENGRGRFNNPNYINLHATVYPILINCKNQSIDSFMEHSSSIIYGTTNYNYYPLLSLYQKYPLDSSIIFQFIPDWVTYDFIEDENTNLLASEFMGSYINSLLEDIDDLILEFLVQIIKKDEKYSIMIINSHKYSDEMVKDFKNTYERILSNIINADSSSDLNSIIKF